MLIGLFLVRFRLTFSTQVVHEAANRQQLAARQNTLSHKPDQYH